MYQYYIGSNLPLNQAPMYFEAGSYGEIRRFIHALETAPEFVVVDNVQLAEGRDSGDGVQLTLAMSTFYREAAQPVAGQP